MEFLIGALVSLTAEGLKWLSKKYEYEYLKPVIIIGVFILSFLASCIFLLLKKYIDITVLLTVWATAIGFYEVVIKNIIKPALLKLK